MSAFARATAVDPLDDGTREARSLTCHYLRPPAGDLRVDVTVERSGRSLSTDGVLLAHSRQLALVVDGGR